MAQPDPFAVPPRHAAAAGIVAAAVSLGVGELLAALVGGAVSPVVAVGNAVVDGVPAAVVKTAIEVFGQADKTALLVGIVLLSAVFGALLGAAAARHIWVAVAGFAAFGVLGVVAALDDPQATASAMVLAVAPAALAGVVVLRLLLSAAASSRRARAGGERRPDVVGAPRPGDRRAFLRLAAVATAAAAVSGWLGRRLTQQANVAAARDAVVLPSPRASRPATASPIGLDVEGLEPYVTPNERFYRIDTALAVPRVDVDGWRLRVTGMVDRPLELTFDDLLARASERHWMTLACVSNEVGGNLVGNARWQGVPLRDVLDRAGVQFGASQVVGRSVDGWTAGFPTEAAFDGRTALVAVGMNGEPLPIEHGFPARLVVPGLYGYVSATKWLSEIELTTLDAFDAYWIPRGWAKQGPIKTQSRIDVPRHGTRLSPGTTPVAGVAWAPLRGISNVEVQVDDEPWAEARLSRAYNDDTWRQWVYEWQATPGPHRLRVRATDGEGRTQTGVRQPVMPDGATGWHTVAVEVTGT